MAYDADVNQHLAQSLGAAGRLPAMGSRQEEIKRWLLGANRRIGAVEEMHKTSPPGSHGPRPSIVGREWPKG